MKYIVEAKKVTKRYEGETEEVLKGVDLCVEEGEFVAVMGRSGSGKSTLLYTISGMDSLSGGNSMFQGRDISAMKEEEISNLRLAGMGFIFQHSYLLKTLSVRDNILLPALKLKKEKKKDIMEKADRLMNKMEIADIGHQDITKISGGQLQRAAICRALMNNPAVIFADEPTGALNSAAATEVMDILGKINQEGTAIVMVTHDKNVAARADRIIFLFDGIIQSEYRQEKYNRVTDLEKRNQEVSQWLGSQGF